MVDVSSTAPVVHHVKHHLAHLPQIQTGFSYMSAIIASAVSGLVFGGLGWYIGKMGLSRVTTEVKNDVQTVSAEVAAAKSVS